jgi:hypothetical protein
MKQLILFCALLGGAVVQVSAQAGDEPNRMPRLGSNAIPLRDQHSYLSKNKAPDYWRFSSFYVPQINQSACSVAAFSVGLNGLRSHFKYFSDNENLVQDKMLASLKDEQWSKRIRGEAIGKSPLVLDDMPSLLEKLVQVNKLPFKITTEVHRFGADPKKDEKKLTELLKANEKSDWDFILVNFKQSEITGDPEGVGHVALVAAYDATQKMVLIFDPDRLWYEPYWAKESALMAAMNTIDPESKKNRGLVFVKASKDK